MVTKLSSETLEAFKKTATSIQSQILKVQSGELKVEETNLFVSQSKMQRDEDGKVIRNRPTKYRKTKLVTGMKFGELILRRKLPPKKGVKPSLRERWRVECSCGTIIPDLPKYYLVRKPNPKTHCGCKTATIKSLNKREFLIWHMIHQRCENPKHASYKHYKERGITLAPEWHKNCEDGKGFERFFEHVGKSPPNTSLDRIRNTEGYYPGNLRWATAEQQRANQGDRIGGYTRDEIEALGMTEDEFVEAILSGDIT